MPRKNSKSNYALKRATQIVTTVHETTLQDNLIAEVQRIIKRSLKGMVLVPVDKGRIEIGQEPEAILRIQSLYLLIDSLSQYVPEPIRSVALKKTGIAVGRSFAHTILDKLVDEPSVTYELFTQVWAQMDARYGWGTITASKFSEEFFTPEEVVISKSFVASDGHSRCAFMEGYIHGVLDQGFRFVWTKNQRDRAPLRRFELRHVQPCVARGEVCEFRIEYGDRQLVDSYELIYDCYEAIRAGRGGNVLVSIRKVLETALQERFGIVLGGRSMSLGSCLHRLSELPVDNVNWERVLDLKDRCNRTAHEQVDSNRDHEMQAFLDASNFLGELRSLTNCGEIGAKLMGKQAGR